MKLFPRAPSKPAKREVSQPSRIIYDILGIILVTLSLLLFLSVWSYSDHDVGWFSPAVSDVSPPHNLIGVVGATMANGLLWLFGMTAYVLPFLITLHGIRLFQKEPLAARLRSVLGSIVFLFCFSAWLEMSRTMFGNPEHLPVAEELLGGRSGQWIAVNLHDFFADTGSLVLLTAGLLVSLLLIRPFSVAAATGQIPTVWGRLKEVMPKSHDGKWAPVALRHDCLCLAISHHAARHSTVPKRTIGCKVEKCPGVHRVSVLLQRVA